MTVTEKECLTALANELKCAICLSVAEPPIARLKCCHSFCRSCVLQALRQASCCPLCKAAASRRDIREDRKLDKTVALFAELDTDNRFHSQALPKLGGNPEAAPPVGKTSRRLFKPKGMFSRVPIKRTSHASKANADAQMSSAATRAAKAPKRASDPGPVSNRVEPQKKQKMSPGEVAPQELVKRRASKPVNAGRRKASTVGCAKAKPEPGKAGTGKAEEAREEKWAAHRKWVLLSSGLSLEEKSTQQQLADACGARLVDKFEPAVTHVVCGNGPALQRSPHWRSSQFFGKAAKTANRIYLLRRTLKFILGVLTGKWEVHMSWVTACLKAGGPVSEEDHEVTEDSAGGRGGPILGRLQAGSVQLLKGWEVFLHGSFSKGGTEEIVKYAGAKLLCRLPPEESTLLALEDNADAPSRTVVLVEGAVGDSCKKPSPKWRGVCVVSTWLTDSAGNFVVKPLTPYLAKFE